MTGWLIALAIVVLLAIVPLGVDARFDDSGPLVRVIAGGIGVLRFPKKKTDKPKREKKPKKKKKAEPAKSGKSAKKKPSGRGGSISDFFPLVRLALDFLGEFRRKLRIDRLEIKVILAGDDPADLAMNYGKIWQALGALWPRLERAFVIKKRDVQVECDFTSDKTLITACAQITITFGRLIALAVKYGIRALKEFLKLKNKRKGGAKHESKYSQYAGKHHSKNSRNG